MGETRAKLKEGKIVGYDTRSTIGQGLAMLQNIQPRSKRFLWDYEFQVTSQWGEDGILNYLCQELALHKPSILEIGTGDFSECNSRFLIQYRNSKAVLIDKFPKLTSIVKRDELYWRSHILVIEEFVTKDNIEDLYNKSINFLNQINILSLDIDGNDWWVLEKLKNLDPEVVVVEYNSIFGHTKAVTIPYQESFDRFKAHPSGLYYGASIKAFDGLMRSRGYSLVGTNRACNNAFFVKKELADNLLLSRPDLVDEGELFVNWNFREARDSKGALIFCSGEERKKTISDCDVWDITLNKSLKVSEI